MNNIELLQLPKYDVLLWNWKNLFYPKHKTTAIIIKVAGIAYYQLKSIYHHLTPGVKLTLKRDKANRFDISAVAVYYRNYKIGYLSMIKNSEIAVKIDNGVVFEVEVHSAIKEKYLPTQELYISIEKFN